MRMAEQKFESLKCEWQSNFRSLVHANMVLVHQRLVFPFKTLLFRLSQGQGNPFRLLSPHLVRALRVE